MIEGKTIAITRSRKDSEEFLKLMTEERAKPISLPTIELVSKGEKIVDEFLDSIKEYDPDYSVFMSSKAVKLLFETARKVSKYEVLRLSVANTIVVAVGPKTRSTLESEGIRVAYTPRRYSSVGVGEVLTRLNPEGKKVILPRSGASTPFLSQLLEKIGLEVKEIYLYNVRTFRDTSQWNEFRSLFSKSVVDGIVFTSASSVSGFFEIMLNDYDEKTLLQKLRKIKAVAIGPFTGNELKKFGIDPIVSEVHTISGAFETIKNIFSLA
ncbi:MAG: uroporphyrinogen-III synthase [Nitrosopumilaceae archaeon]